MSLTCQNCPDVVQALNSMSVINPRIRVQTIDGALFQDEVTERGIMAVPTVFLNGEVLFQAVPAPKRFWQNWIPAPRPVPPASSRKRIRSTC